jgi:hypothetical protein
VNLYRATILEEGQSSWMYNSKGLKTCYAVAGSSIQAARLIAGSIGMTEHIDVVVCVEKNVLIEAPFERAERECGISLTV